MYKRPSAPIKTHGGKWYLAQEIVRRMPPHLVYCEPFCGGCSVLFARDPNQDWYEGASDYDGSAKMRGSSEVVNDINGELTNFWDCLKNVSAFKCMQRTLDATPFSEAEYTSALSVVDSPPGSVAPVDRAVAFFIRCRQSRQGLQKDFATVSRNRTRRFINEQVSSWLTAIDGLEDIHARLQRVLILNRPALEVIRTQDGPKTLFYLDPPYLDETRVSHGEYGEHEMSPEDHEDLLKVIHRIKGKFLLSGYRSDLYNDYAAGYGWRRVEKQIDCKASSQEVKPVKTECLWMNFEPTELSR